MLGRAVLRPRGPRPRMGESASSGAGNRQLEQRRVTVGFKRAFEKAFRHMAGSEQPQGALDEARWRGGFFESVTGGGEFKVDDALEQDRQLAVLSRFRRSSSISRFLCLIHSLDSLFNAALVERGVLAFLTSTNGARDAFVSCVPRHLARGPCPPCTIECTGHPPGPRYMGERST